MVCHSSSGKLQGVVCTLALLLTSYSGRLLPAWNVIQFFLPPIHFSLQKHFVCSTSRRRNWKTPYYRVLISGRFPVGLCYASCLSVLWKIKSAWKNVEELGYRVHLECLWTSFSCAVQNCIFRFVLHNYHKHQFRSNSLKAAQWQKIKRMKWKKCKKIRSLTMAMQRQKWRMNRSECYSIYCAINGKPKKNERLIPMTPKGQAKLFSTIYNRNVIIRKSHFSELFVLSNKSERIQRKLSAYVK